MKTKSTIRAVFLCMAIVVSVLWLSSQALAQGCDPNLYDNCDLIGEFCLADIAIVNSPAGEFSYCVMQGRLGTDEAIEIDDLAATFADANVFNGTTANDPDLPFISGATYIDWDDLTLNNVTEDILGSVENYRILDTVANDDYTMLRPQNASCLNDGSVVPKEDFTQSYIANNDEYIYMAQERRTNNGNSVYYWLLTSKPPYVDANSSDCGGQTRGQLLFDLTQNEDFEVIVNFPDSSDPTSGAVFFRKYTGPSLNGLLADDAVFAPGWVIDNTAIPNFAMNDTEPPHDGDDGLPHWGSLDRQGNPIPQDSNTYAEATFAEWAIDLGVVFGGSPTCGERLFLTGLSRASTGQVGDPTEPSALKDLVGPKLYSFGEITASATIVGDCDLGFTYEATAVGLDGETPIPSENLTCSWTCTAEDGSQNPLTVVLSDDTACSGTGTVTKDGGTPATVSCSVEVTDSFSTCTDDATGGDSVLEPITVSISPSPTTLGCTVPGTPGFDNGTVGGLITYSSTVTGGDGNYSYTWYVSGPNVASTCGNTSTCSIDVPDNAFCTNTTVKVFVDDSDSRCPGDDSETEVVTKQTILNISDN